MNGPGWLKIKTTKVETITKKDQSRKDHFLRMMLMPMPQPKRAA